MSGDGLYYIPDGFRESARGSFETADMAESTRRYLDQATPNASSYAGADAFVNAVITTRDKQSRGVARAAEGRENMAGADHGVADIGETLSADADTTLNNVASVVSTNSPVARGIADSV